MSARAKKPSSLCSTPGCENEEYARGYCRSCYDRIRRTVGFDYQKKCKVPGCDRPAVDKGYCSGHKYQAIDQREDKRCKYCGVIIQAEKGKLCDSCRSKVNRWRRGTWWLCVSDPTPNRPFKGGHFENWGFQETIEEGLYPVGMIFEKYMTKKYKGAYMVVIQNERYVLVRIEGHQQKGDGFLLKP